jgi:hypothetical protein
MAMPLTVIFDGVAAAHNFLRKVCIALHAFPHAEKCRLRSVRRESFEHARSHGRVGAVVDSDCHFTARAAGGGKADPIRAQ